MKIKLPTILALLSIGLLLMSTPGAIAQEDHGGHDSAEDQCEDPTQEEHVVADPNNDGSNEFSVTTITTETGACLMIEFENGSDSDEHSFAIEHMEGIMEHDVHLHIMNSSVEHKMVNLQMPDEAAEIPFFCNVSDHKDDGMVGQIVVESSSPLPGFGVFTAISAMAAMIIAVPILRKKN